MKPLSLACLAVALLFSVYMVWGAVDYAGLYAILAEWQLNVFGSFAWAMTVVIPIMVVATPLVLFGVIGLDKADAAKPRRPGPGLGFLAIVGLVGLGLAAVGVSAITKAVRAPTLNDPLQIVDLAQLGDVAPPTGHLRLVCRADNGRVLALRRRGKGGSTSENSFTPVVPVGANAQAPVRFVVKQLRLSPEGPPPEIADNPEGLVFKEPLSGAALAGFKRAGAPLAAQVYVLDPTGVDVTLGNWFLGVICLVLGVGCLALALWPKKKSAPSPT